MYKCKIITGSTSDPYLDDDDQTDIIESKFNKWAEKNPNIKISEIKFKSLNDKPVLFVLYEKFVRASDISIPHIPKDVMPTCPNCESTMKIRANSTTGALFFGCSKFPKCKGMRPFDEEDWKKFLDNNDPGPSREGDIPF